MKKKTLILGCYKFIKLFNFESKKNEPNKFDEKFSARSERIQLPEQKWNLKKPLILFVQDQEAPASKVLRASIPNNLSKASFKNLRLNFCN